MNFRKISEQSLAPPAPFSENILQFFLQTGCTSTKFAMKFFRSEMTPPLFEAFSGNSWPKLPFLKQKKLQWNFLDRKWPPHPLSEIFRKFIRIRGDRLPLAWPRDEIWSKPNLNCNHNFTIFKLFKPTVRKVVKRLVGVALIDLCYVSHCWFEPHEPRHWVTSMQRLKAKTHLTINSKCGRQPSLQNLFHILD